MRASRSLSDWLRALSRRERRFVAVGGALAVAALAATFVVLPLADRWAAREATYAANREQWTRLQALVAGEARVRRTLDEQRRSQRSARERLLSGASPALAASGLQMLLQQYAEESLVQLNRVDVAGQPRPAGAGLLAMPVSLQGQGDIYGLVDFLYRLQHGGRLLVVEEMSVSPRSSWLKGDQPLVWSVKAHGLYAAEGGS